MCNELSIIVLIYCWLTWRRHWTQSWPMVKIGSWQCITCSLMLFWIVRILDCSCVYDLVWVLGWDTWVRLALGYWISLHTLFAFISPYWIMPIRSLRCYIMNFFHAWVLVGCFHMKWYALSGCRRNIIMIGSGCSP